MWYIYFIIGIVSQFTVTIVRNPAGTPVDGSTNTFVYPIFSSITLTCMVTSSDGSTPNTISYQWNTTGCYTNSGRNPRCFPYGQRTQIVVDNDLTAEDAGTFNCIADIAGAHHTSMSLTLRISGEMVCM